jgi:hypothetical protein
MNLPAIHPLSAIALGAGGLRVLTFSAPHGARAEVCLYGAHVVSWIPAGGPAGQTATPEAGRGGKG